MFQQRKTSKSDVGPRRRQSNRRASPALSLRQAAKTCLLWCYVRLWAPARNFFRALLGRCHTAVLVYHRIDDGLRDSVTVGVEQFRRQLEILKRHYEVLDASELLAGRGRPRRRVGVVITFDDGYSSCFTAAGLLRSAALPACFFISTAIVGTESAFPHDLQKLGRRVPALDWGQVRQMRDWGFHFGNHTARHLNLATLPLEEGLAEIKTASEELERRLGPNGSANWLAYPFGRRSDISKGLRESLPACGVACCFSACGGVNDVDFDPMDIRRQGIDHNFSDLAFRAAVEGWKVRPPRERSA